MDGLCRVMDFSALSSVSSVGLEESISLHTTEVGNTPVKDGTTTKAFHTAMAVLQVQFTNTV